MRLHSPLSPSPVRPFVLVLLVALVPSVLSDSADEAYNSSAASFLALPSSFHTALSVLVRVVSSLSLVFSLLVVAAFFLVPRLRQEYNARFVLLLALSDILYSFLLLLGPLSLASSPSSLLFPASASPSGWCSAHSSLLLYASLASLAWTSVIAINHFLVVYHSASILQLRRYQLTQHLSAWLLPLLPVLLVLLLPSSNGNAAMASPLCWFGMADTRAAYPSSAWLLLLPQLLSCTLLSGCYMLALRYGRRLTSQVEAGPASGTQTKEPSQIGVAGGTMSQKVSVSIPAAAAQSGRTVLSDKYRQMRRKVSLYLICSFLLTLPLLLSSISLLSSTALPAGYLSFLFLLQAVVGSSQGLLHSVVYAWNLRLFYHLYPPASHPALLTSLLHALHLPPPPPTLSPATSPPFPRASRIHPSAMGQPATSPYMTSRAVSSMGRHSWRRSSVMMAPLPGYVNRLPMRAVDGGTGTAGGGGREEDDNGTAGSPHSPRVLSIGVLLPPPAVEPAEIRFSTLSTDGSSDSMSPFVSRNTASLGFISGGGRRFSVTTTLAGLPAVGLDGGSFSLPHTNSHNSSPRLSSQGDALPAHLQPLTSFSSFSNPQSALPWIPSLSLPPQHQLAPPALAALGLAPVRGPRGGSSFSSSSRASVSFYSPTHPSLTPRSEGGTSDSMDGGSSIRVLVSAWDSGNGLTARRSSQDENKELETLNEEDEKDSEEKENSTPSTGTVHSESLRPLQTVPWPSPSLSSSPAHSPSAASSEQSRGSVIVFVLPAVSPTAGTHSRSQSPSASNNNCVTPPSIHHSAGSRYSFSLASPRRMSLSTPSSSRSPPHLASRVMPAGYRPRPSSSTDRRQLRVNRAPPPATASATVSPRIVAAVPHRSSTDAAESVVIQVDVKVQVARRKKSKVKRGLSLPSVVAAMPVEVRTGASAEQRLMKRRQSEPLISV